MSAQGRPGQRHDPLSGRGSQLESGWQCQPAQCTDEMPVGKKQGNQRRENRGRQCVTQAPGKLVTESIRPALWKTATTGREHQVAALELAPLARDSKKVTSLGTYTGLRGSDVEAPRLPLLAASNKALRTVRALSAHGEELTGRFLLQLHPYLVEEAHCLRNVEAAKHLADGGRRSTGKTVGLNPVMRDVAAGAAGHEYLGANLSERRPESGCCVRAGCVRPKCRPSAPPHPHRQSTTSAGSPILLPFPHSRGHIGAVDAMAPSLCRSSASSALTQLQGAILKELPPSRQI